MWHGCALPGGVCRLTGIEIAAASATYAWQGRGGRGRLPAHHAGGEEKTSAEVSRPELYRRVHAALDEARPDVVFVPGWASPAAWGAFQWSLQRPTPIVVMSDSTEWDEPRSAWKEWVKSKLVALGSAALVAGARNRDYIVKLGMPAGHVFLGYDVVDNAYFKRAAGTVRAEAEETRRAYRLPENYFLASARFVEKKNLPRLIEAYARYRKSCAGQPWSLVLLGDGELRPELEAQVAALGLGEKVQMPGFRQYADLPAYYALAGAFVHASTVEPWGLVVNEAMASRLPVIVSETCGCVPELVHDGVNGFTFDPLNVAALADRLGRVSAPDFPRDAFSTKSGEIIAEWGAGPICPGAFGSGRVGAVPPRQSCALAQPGNPLSPGEAMKTVCIMDSVSRANGGIFEAESRLQRTLSESGVDVHVVGLHDEHTESDTPAWKPLVPVTVPIAGPRQFGYARELMEAISVADADLGYLAGLWKYPSLATRRWIAQTRRPLVIAPHGMLDAWGAAEFRAQEENRRLPVPGRAASRRGLPACALPGGGRCDARVWVESPICIVPNGVELPSADGEPVTRHRSFPPGRKVLLYLGRLHPLHPKKGLANIVKAWSAARAMGKEWVLVIAGWDQGGHEADLKRLAGDLANPDSEEASIHFIGPQFGADKAACYRSCDAFVLPSFSEGLPMTVLEAWAYAKPVLMTDECNLPEGFGAQAALRIQPTETSIPRQARRLVQHGGRRSRENGCTRAALG